MEMTKLQCTAPGCTKCLPPKAMWLPEWKALVRAAGKRVGIEEFPKFALCGHHGHRLRETGVRVYRYLASVERQERFETERRSEELAWQPFAELFAPKPGSERKAKGRQGQRRGRDGRGVGQGLSRLSKLDAEKRKQQEVKTVQGNDSATAQPSSSPSGDSSNGEAAE